MTHSNGSDVKTRLKQILLQRIADYPKLIQPSPTDHEIDKLALQALGASAPGRDWPSEDEMRAEAKVELPVIAKAWHEPYRIGFLDCYRWLTKGQLQENAPELKSWPSEPQVEKRALEDAFGPFTEVYQHAFKECYRWLSQYRKPVVSSNVTQNDQSNISESHKALCNISDAEIPKDVFFSAIPLLNESEIDAEIEAASYKYEAMDPGGLTTFEIFEAGARWMRSRLLGDKE